MSAHDEEAAWWEADIQFLDRSMAELRSRGGWKAGFLIPKMEAARDHSAEQLEATRKAGGAR